MPQILFAEEISQDEVSQSASTEVSVVQEDGDTVVVKGYYEITGDGGDNASNGSYGGGGVGNITTLPVTNDRLLILICSLIVGMIASGVLTVVAKRGAKHGYRESA